MDVVLTLSSDGKQIGYGMDYIAGENTDAEGTWISNSDGGGLKELLSMAKDYNGTPFDVQFSANGRYLMTHYFYLAPLEQMSFSAIRIAEVDTGNEVPVTANEAAYSIPQIRHERWAAWSPTGSILAYVLPSDIHSGEFQYQAGLYLVEEPGKEAKLIYPGSFWPPFNIAINRTITWATNNTILLTNGSHQHLLLHLGVK